MTQDLQTSINNAWEARAEITYSTKGEVRDAVEQTLALLDQGKARVAEKVAGQWVVNQWLKKAVLLSFALNDMRLVSGGPDSGTMVDTWVTIGSCAQIGKNCHISGGVGIGGVLEPLQSDPVIIEDGCFIGARSEVAEGVIVEQGAVLSMGVYLGASTKIVYRDSGEIVTGRVPAYSVVVPGSLGGGAREDGSVVPSLYCAVIIKQVDARTRSKTSINELLRD